MTGCPVTWVEYWGPKSCHLEDGHGGPHWSVSGFMLPNPPTEPALRVRANVAAEIRAHTIDTLPEPPEAVTW